MPPAEARPPQPRGDRYAVGSPARAVVTLHLPRGLPGSGKSTLARGLAAAGAVHVELDAHRRRVWPQCPSSWDPYTGPGLAVQIEFEAEVAEHLAAGRDVVADRTNLDGRGVARLRQLAPWARLVLHDLTPVPLGVCVRRDAVRPVGERVGEAGIRALWERWLARPSGEPVRTTLKQAPVVSLDVPSPANGTRGAARSRPGAPEPAQPEPSGTRGVR
ncbi:AAA family ATPase [Streptomyces sp. NPDC046465]|uniref:AAA family ATPase n=1 Tax=Streptomyces sp. NPDC046465 TaxID=3155810 RepID=UPI00340C4437